MDKKIISKAITEAQKEMGFCISEEAQHIVVTMVSQIASSIEIQVSRSNQGNVRTAIALRALSLILDKINDETLSPNVLRLTDEAF